MYRSNESEEELPSSNYTADLGSCHFSTTAIYSPKCKNDSIYKCATRWVKYTTLGIFPFP